MAMRRLGLVGLVLVFLLPRWVHADEPVLQPVLLRVVTYNIRYANADDGLDIWPNRIDAVASFLDQQDVFGLQEVTYAQLEGLRARLTAFDAFGVGRDDGKQGGEHAMIFYRRDRLESMEQGTFWLSESPEQVGVAGWDASLPRACTWMILREKASNRSMLVANTHFDHRGAQARLESGNLIRCRLKEKAGDLAVILLGDFNCEVDSEPYRALTADGDLLDARAVSKTAPTGPDSTWNGFEKIETGRIIDHIFVHGPVQVLAFGVQDPKTSTGRFASDHLPVHTLIGLETPSGQK